MQSFTMHKRYLLMILYDSWLAVYSELKLNINHQYLYLMFIGEENPGGSFNAHKLPLKRYIREYKREGNHVKRYNFARKLITGKDVIEVGCGYGIGSILLGRHYKSYLGLDVDEGALNYAISKIKPFKEKTNFGLMNDYILKKDTAKADVVICFEVIEHVRNPSQFLLQLEALLKVDGVLLISTPNGLSSQGDHCLYRTKYHLNEFTPEEFLRLLGSKSKINLFGEKRKDGMDVKFLRSRLQKSKDDTINLESKSSKNLKESLYGIIYKLVYFVLNYQIFWKIYQTNIARESEKLNCSTLIAKVVK